MSYVKRCGPKIITVIIVFLSLWSNKFSNFVLGQTAQDSQGRPVREKFLLQKLRQPKVFVEQNEPKNVFRDVIFGHNKNFLGGTWKIYSFFFNWKQISTKSEGVRWKYLTNDFKSYITGALLGNSHFGYKLLLYFFNCLFWNQIQGPILALGPMLWC